MSFKLCYEERKYVVTNVWSVLKNEDECPIPFRTSQGTNVNVLSVVRFLAGIFIQRDDTDESIDDMQIIKITWDELYFA